MCTLRHAERIAANRPAEPRRGTRVHRLDDLAVRRGSAEWRKGGEEEGVVRQARRVRERGERRGKKERDVGKRMEM